jgi:hypothetical protein
MHGVTRKLSIGAASLFALSLITLALFVPSLNTTAADDCQFFPETSFNVCGRFLTYWKNNGALAQQGYPISNVFEEKNADPPAGDGKVHRVQYFQRARFEEHTENAAPYDVLLGLIGGEQYSAKYGPHTGPSVIPAAGCLPTLITTDSFVQACMSDYNPKSGSDVTVYARLIINGQVVTGAAMTANFYYATTRA